MHHSTKPGGHCPQFLFKDNDVDDDADRVVWERLEDVVYFWFTLQPSPSAAELRSH